MSNSWEAVCRANPVAVGWNKTFFSVSFHSCFRGFRINVRNQLTTLENAITYPNALCLSPPKFCVNIVFGFSWELKMAPRGNKNNAYAKFWGDKKRTLWYVMVFLEWSVDSSGVNIHFFCFFSLSLTTKY